MKIELEVEDYSIVEKHGVYYFATPINKKMIDYLINEERKCFSSECIGTPSAYRAVSVIQNLKDLKEKLLEVV